MADRDARPRRPRTTKATRRNGLRWRNAERASLLRRWGTLSKRAMRAQFGRTSGALALEARALDLPPLSAAAGRRTASVACRALGVWHDTLYRLLRECGIGEGLGAPLREAPAAYRWRSVDPAAAGDLLAVRDARTLTLVAWSSSRGRCAPHDRRRAGRYGVILRPERPRAEHARYPVEMLDAVVAGTPARAEPSGPWVELWRAVLAMSPRPCAPWALALAAWDLARGPSPAWVGHLPPKVRKAALSLAASLRRNRDA